MSSFVARHRLPLLGSLALHAVLAALLTLSLSFARPFDVRPPPLAVKATVVDADRIAQELQKLDQAQRAAELEQQRRAEEAERRADQARREQEQEQQRLAELKRQQEAQRVRESEEASKRQAELERQQKAESERIAELERRQKTERERLAKIEQERKAEEQRLARLAEQRREEEERRRKAEADAQARTAREAQLRNEIAAEEQRQSAAQASALLRYKALLAQRVQRNWLKPAGAPAGLNCSVQVRQLPDGSVIDVRVLSCNGDAAVVRSIENAVNRSSPLPLPEDRSLFQREIIFDFIPQD